MTSFPCPCDPEAEHHAAVPEEYQKKMNLCCTESSSTRPPTAEHMVLMASVLPPAGKVMIDTGSSLLPCILW